MIRPMLAARWSEAGAKLVALAEAVPGDRYDHRPVAGVRTAAEQLRHVAFWNRYLAGTLRGEQPDGAANELPESKFRGKQAIVGALRESFTDAEAALAQPDSDERCVETVLPLLEHVGEHYGQLVVYSRLIGVVPPASRG